MPMRDITGPELRKEREDAKLTQAQVAERLGCDRTVVVRNEAKASVDPRWAYRYREALSDIATEGVA